MEGVKLLIPWRGCKTIGSNAEKPDRKDDRRLDSREWDKGAVVKVNEVGDKTIFLCIVLNLFNPNTKSRFNSWVFMVPSKLLLGHDSTFRLTFFRTVITLLVFEVYSLILLINLSR
jgi:hypothetical protein